MITNRYPYQEIKRETGSDGMRRYATATGALPSVTTILTRTKPAEDRAGLEAWRKRVGKENADRIVKEAASVGTVMHNYLEQWVVNDSYEVPGTNLVYKVADRMARTVIENIQAELDEVWGTEVSLYYPDLYAGATDLVGVWKKRPAIMDFKQTNRPKKREWIDDYFLQTAAYGTAHNAMFGTEIETAAIFMCSRDCEFQLFELEPDEFHAYAEKWALRVAEFYALDK